MIFQMSHISLVHEVQVGKLQLVCFLQSLDLLSLQVLLLQDFLVEAFNELLLGGHIVAVKRLTDRQSVVN